MLIRITHAAAIWMITMIVHAMVVPAMVVPAMVGPAMVGPARAENDVSISGDAAKGKRAFSVCKACHQIGLNARNRSGPPLNGVIGRPAGSMKGFRYSKAMNTKAREGLVWDEESLFEYLENPSAFIGGRSKMTLRRTDESTRRDIIAYLRQITADGRERQVKQSDTGQ